LVGDTVRRTHRVTRALKHDFPHVLPWLQDKDTALLCDVLRHWPTLKAAHLARRTTLERLFRPPHVRAADVSTTRIEAITSAGALTTDAGGIAPHALLVHALVAPRRVTVQAIADCDHAIAPRAQDHPAFPVLDALPGAGAVLAPRLLVAFGAQRERDTAAEDLQKSAGMAPGTERSGTQAWVHGRLQGPQCLRQTFVAWAAASTRHAFWAHVSYQPQRDQGKAHQAAVRALAFTWMRLLSRCWQNRTPSDASLYLQALKRRSAPRLHNLAQ
jgi:hypothetical protein